MMEEIKAYKLGRVEASVRIMQQEAEIRLLMGWFRVKTGKQVLLVVVFVVMMALLT